MTASALPAAGASHPLPALSALAGQASNVPLTRVSLAYIEARFSSTCASKNRRARCGSTAGGAARCSCRVPCSAACAGSKRLRHDPLAAHGDASRHAAGRHAAHPRRAAGRTPAAARRRRNAVRAVLERIDGIEAQGIAAIDVSSAYWRTLGNCLAARLALPEYTAERHAAWLAGSCHDDPIQYHMHAEAAPHPRSRRCARLALAGFAAVGLAALAWAALSPLPRLTYNPSNSVAVGWYRIEPFDRAPPAATSAVRGQYRAGAATRQAAMLAAQRGYLPTRVPLLKRGRGCAATRLHRRRAGTHRRRACGHRAACRPAGPAAAILAALPPP